MRDPRLPPDPALARRLDAAADDYADMPPLTGPPSSSMSAYRGTTVRHAAARVGTADASTQVGSSALLSSRRAYWTNEQQQLQQSFERYHSHRQELLQLPYPTPPAAERPPPVSATVPIHRVYILRCATCDTFLSDRGMRAVLLLKPHIILFSTDSAPANSATFWPDGPAQEQVERTCDCLTSSINCHGCGKTVGYNIVSPCSKCNASVQKHQRSANHHRFVFHHNEVTARERTYYPGDPGVSNPIVRLQPSPTPSRDSSRTPTPLSRARERVEASADKDAPSVRLSRLRTSSRAARARDRGLRLLKPGDTVYWHMLVTGGERAQSIDPRLREPIWRENEGR